MTELEKKLTNALLMIRSHINEPEVITSILDKNIGTDKDIMLDTILDTSDPAGEAILGELTPDNTEDLFTEEDMQKHFGEQQAEGLDNLLEGLRDTPHDDRW